MIRKDISIFILTIFLVAINNNCFEYLTDVHYQAPQILFYRGVFTVVGILCYSAYKRTSSFPRNISRQWIRFITTGASLWLILESYQYLAAGTVSLLQRMDIPFLIFLSLVTVGSKSRSQVILSIITVLIICYLTINPEMIHEDQIGFIYAFISVVMVAVGYFTVYRGSKEETIPALINVGGISWIIFGAALISFKKLSWHFETFDLCIVALSSVINVILFYIIVQLYRKYPAERALLPFVLAILGTSIIEMIMEQKIYGLAQILINVLLTGLLSIICLGSTKPTNKEAH